MIFTAKYCPLCEKDLVRPISGSYNSDMYVKNCDTYVKNFKNDNVFHFKYDFDSVEITSNKYILVYYFGPTGSGNDGLCDIYCNAGMIFDCRINFSKLHSINDIDKKLDSLFILK